MEEKKMCCFLGHRKIPKTEILYNKLSNIVEDLIINKEVHVFLFGSKSDFDKLCYTVVTELKEKYPYIRRVYVRAEFPYISDDYKEYLLKRYEDTYFPQKAINAGKAVYVERNCEMIERSRFCVVCYMKDYEPPRRKNSKKDLLDYQPKSGTKLAYEYAQRKKKIIINVAE